MGDEDPRAPARDASGMPGLAVVAAATVFVVYWATLAPSVHYGDSPELTLAAIELGVAHPTGYPLYTLLGFVWSQLVAVGDPAWRLNLFSALAAAGAIGVLVAVLQRLSGEAAAAWLGGLLLGFAPGLWSQATIAEVYALHLLILALLLWALVRWEDSREPRWLRVAALVLGCGFAHHGMTLLLLPLVAAVAVRSRRHLPTLREALRLGALGLAPLLLYALLPWAARRSPHVAWGDPSTLHAFWYHVSGGQYRGFLAAPAPVQLPSLLGAHLRDLADQFGPWFFPFAALGLGVLWRRSARLALGTVLAYAATLGYAWSYRIVDVEPYFLPAQAFFAVWIALGAGALLAGIRRLPGPSARALPRLLAVVPLLTLVSHWPAQDRSTAYGPHDQALAALVAAPPGSLLLTRGPTGYAPVYASVALGLRPDVEVVDLFLRLRARYAPELEAVRRGPPDPRIPRELAVAARAVRAWPGRVLLWPGAPDSDWSRVGLFRIRRGVFDELTAQPPDLHVERGPEGARSALFGGRVALLGVELEPRTVAAGGIVRARFTWQPRGSTIEPVPDVIAVLAAPNGELLTDAIGRPLLQQRHPLGQGAPLGDYPPGDLFVETLALLVPRDTPPGDWQLWLGLTEGEGLLPLPNGQRFAPGAALHVVEERMPLWSTPTRSAYAPIPLGGPRQAHAGGGR